jgi:hypothetical protein
VLKRQLELDQVRGASFGHPQQKSPEPLCIWEGYFVKLLGSDATSPEWARLEASV